MSVDHLFEALHTHMLVSDIVSIHKTVQEMLFYVDQIEPCGHNHGRRLPLAKVYELTARFPKQRKALLSLLINMRLISSATNISPELPPPDFTELWCAIQHQQADWVRWWIHYLPLEGCTLSPLDARLLVNGAALNQTSDMSYIFMGRPTLPPAFPHVLASVVARAPPPFQDMILHDLARRGVILRQEVSFFTAAALAKVQIAKLRTAQRNTPDAGPALQLQSAAAAAEELARSLLEVGPSPAADPAQSGSAAARAMYGLLRVHPHDVMPSLAPGARVTGVVAHTPTPGEAYSTAAFVKSAAAGFAPVDFTRVVMRLTRAGLLFAQKNDRESLAFSHHLDHDAAYANVLDDYHKLRAAKQSFTRSALLGALVPFGRYSPFHRFMCSYLNAAGLVPALQAYRTWYGLEPLAQHAGDVANINFKHLLRFVPRPERQIMLLAAFQSRPLVVPIQPYNALDDMLFSFYPSDYRGVHFAFTPQRPVSLSTMLQDLGYHISTIFAAAQGRRLAVSRQHSFIDTFVEFFQKFCVYWLSRCAPIHAAMAAFNAGLAIAWEHQKRAVALAAASPESLSGANGTPAGYLRDASGELLDPLLIQTLCHRLCTAAVQLSIRNFDPIKSLLGSREVNRGARTSGARTDNDASRTKTDDADSDDDDGKRPTLVVKNETGLAITNAVIVLKNAALGDYFFGGASASEREMLDEYNRLRDALMRADRGACQDWLVMFARLNDCVHAFVQIVESCGNRERAQSSIVSGALARTAAASPAAAAATVSASANAPGGSSDPAAAAAATAAAAAAHHQAQQAGNSSSAGAAARSAAVTHMYSLCLSLMMIAVEWIADAYNPTAITAAAEAASTGVPSPLALPARPPGGAKATIQELASAALGQGMMRAGRWNHQGDLGQAWPATASTKVYDPAEAPELWWMIKSLITVFYTACSSHGIPVEGAGASPTKLKGQPIHSLSGTMPPPGHVLRVITSFCLLFYVPLPTEIDAWWRSTPTIDTLAPPAAAAASEAESHLERKIAETELVSLLLSLLQTGLRPSAVLAQILALPPRRGGVMTAPPSYEALSSASSTAADGIAEDLRATTVVERVLQHLVVLTERDQVWLSQVIFAAPPKDRSRGLPLQALFDVVTKPSRYVLAWPDAKDKALAAKIAVPELQVMRVDPANPAGVPLRSPLYAGLADINAQRLEKVALLFSTMLQTGQFNMLRTLVRVCFPADPIAHFIAFLAAFRRRQFAKPPLSASLAAYSSFASPSAAAPWVKYAQVRMHEHVVTSLSPRERQALDLEDDPQALALAQLAHVSAASVDDETNGGSDAPAEYCFALFAAELRRQETVRDDYNASKVRAAALASAGAGTAEGFLLSAGEGIAPVAVPAVSAVVRIGERRVWLGQAAWSRAVCRHLWERFLALQSFLTDYDRKYIEALCFSYSWLDGLEPLSKLPGGLLSVPAGIVAVNEPQRATSTKVTVHEDGSFSIQQTIASHADAGAGAEDENKDGEGPASADAGPDADAEGNAGPVAGDDDGARAGVIVLDGAAAAPSHMAARAAGVVVSSVEAMAEVAYTALLQELDALAAMETISGVSAPDRAALIDTALHQLDACNAPLPLRAALFYQTAAVLMRRTVLPPVDAALTALAAPGSVPPRLEPVRPAALPRGVQPQKQVPGAGYPQSLYSLREERAEGAVLVGAGDMLCESALSALRLGASGRVLASSLLADSDPEAAAAARLVDRDRKAGAGAGRGVGPDFTGAPLSRGRVAAARAEQARQHQSEQQQAAGAVPPAVAAAMEQDRVDSALQVVRALVLASLAWRTMLDGDAVVKARALARETAEVPAARFPDSTLPAVGMPPQERARLSLVARRCSARAMWLMTIYDLYSVKLAPKRLLGALPAAAGCYYSTRAAAAAGALHSLSRAAGDVPRPDIERELGHEEHSTAIVSRALLEAHYDGAVVAAQAKVRVNHDVVVDLANGARKRHVIEATAAAKKAFDADPARRPGAEFNKDAAVTAALESFVARTPAVMTADSLAVLPIFLLGFETFPPLRPGARVPWSPEDGAARRRELREADAKRRKVAQMQREARRQMLKQARLARRAGAAVGYDDDDDDEDEEEDEDDLYSDMPAGAAARDAADAAAAIESQSAEELGGNASELNRLIDDSFFNDTPDISAALVLSAVHALVQRCRLRSALMLLCEVSQRPVADRVRQLVLGHPPLVAFFHMLRVFFWLADPNLGCVDTAAGRRVVGAELVRVPWLAAPAPPGRIVKAAQKQANADSVADGNAWGAAGSSGGADAGAAAGLVPDEEMVNTLYYLHEGWKSDLLAASATAAAQQAAANPVAAAADAAVLRGMDLALASTWARLQEVGLLQLPSGAAAASAGAEPPGGGKVDPEDSDDDAEAAALDGAPSAATIMARAQDRVAGRPRYSDLASLVSTVYGLGVKARLFVLDHLTKSIGRFVSPHLTVASTVFSRDAFDAAAAADALSVPTLAHNTASALVWMLPQFLALLHTSRRVAMTEEPALLEAKVRVHFARAIAPRAAPGGGGNAIPISRTAHMAAVLGLLVSRTRPIALSSWLPATLPLVMHTADVFELSPLTVVGAPPAALFAELLTRAHTHRLVPREAAAGAAGPRPTVSTSIRSVSAWSVLRNFFSLGQAQIHIRADYHTQRYRAHAHADHPSAGDASLLASAQARAVPSSVVLRVGSQSHVDYAVDLDRSALPLGDLGGVGGDSNSPSAAGGGPFYGATAQSLFGGIDSGASQYAWDDSRDIEALCVNTLVDTLVTLQQHKTVRLALAPQWSLQTYQRFAALAPLINPWVRSATHWHRALGYALWARLQLLFPTGNTRNRLLRGGLASARWNCSATKGPSWLERLSSASAAKTRGGNAAAIATLHAQGTPDDVIRGASARFAGASAAASATGLKGTYASTAGSGRKHGTSASAIVGEPTLIHMPAAKHPLDLQVELIIAAFVAFREALHAPGIVYLQVEYYQREAWTRVSGGFAPSAWSPTELWERARRIMEVEEPAAVQARVVRMREQADERFGRLTAACTSVLDLGDSAYVDELPPALRPTVEYDNGAPLMDPISGLPYNLDDADEGEGEEEEEEEDEDGADEGGAPAVDAAGVVDGADEEDDEEDAEPAVTSQPGTDVVRGAASTAIAPINTDDTIAAAVAVAVHADAEEDDEVGVVIPSPTSRAGATDTPASPSAPTDHSSFAAPRGSTRSTSPFDTDAAGTTTAGKQTGSTSPAPATNDPAPAYEPVAKSTAAPVEGIPATQPASTPSPASSALPSTTAPAQTTPAPTTPAPTTSAPTTPAPMTPASTATTAAAALAPAPASAAAVQPLASAPVAEEDEEDEYEYYEEEDEYIYEDEDEDENVVAA